MYYKDKALYPIWGFATGIVIFIIIYGVKVLNPLYVDWLLGRGDLTQHYLGAQFFCRSNWMFPIGLSDQLAYPIKTSVIFTDSIPILAIPLKLFGMFLPDNFQYFGVFGLLSMGFQGYFAVKIFNIWKIDWRITLIGSVFLITAPIMLYRMFKHTSLGAQWIILAAIYLYLRYDSMENMKFILYWGLLGFFIIGIHTYFFPMCFFFVLGSVVNKIINEEKIRIYYFAPIVTYVLGAILNFWLLGGFSSKAIGGADGFKAYSFNLNSFFNSRGFSRLISQLDSVSDFQHEGFAYLGVGIICLLIICIFVDFFTINKNKIKIQSIDLILICIGVIYLLIAVSPVISFGDKELIEIPIPQVFSEIWAFFRATGRFIWPVWYLLVLYSIRKIQKLGIKIGIAVLVGCMILQIFDISNVLKSRNKWLAKTIVYKYTDDEFWQQLTQYRKFKHICISFTDYEISKWLKLGAIALKYDLTTNAFYFAREIDGMRDNTEVLKWQEPNEDSIYVFLPEQIELLEDNMHSLRYYYLKDFVIGISWLEKDGTVNNFSYE